MRAKTGLMSRLVFFAFAACPHPVVEPTEIRTSASSAETPGRLTQPKIAGIVGCDRPFVHRGETYPADSPQAQDASVLKAHVSEVPEARALLETYQERRQRSRLSAYTGSIGIFMMILANSVLKRAPDDSTAGSLKSVFQVGGLALTAGGFLYSFSLLRTNERLIPQAVGAYNRARPEEPIELKFETGWSF